MERIGGKRADPERRRAAVERLGQLREAGELTAAHVRLAASGLGVRERTVWRWLRLAAGRPGGPAGRGAYQLSEADREAYARYRGNMAAVHRARVAALAGPDAAEVLAAGVPVPGLGRRGRAGGPRVSTPGRARHALPRPGRVPGRQAAAARAEHRTRPQHSRPEGPEPGRSWPSRAGGPLTPRQKPECAARTSRRPDRPACRCLGGAAPPRWCQRRRDRRWFRRPNRRTGADGQQEPRISALLTSRDAATDIVVTFPLTLS